MDQINIKQLNLEMSTLKDPITFLFILMSYNDEITDYNLSIILRVYLKYHSTIALNYNLISFFKKELSNKKLSWKILFDYYKIINKKINLILVLKKWHSFYNNPNFWKLKLTDQMDYLQQIKEHFLGVFDCSKGGVYYYVKLGMLLKNPNNDKHLLLEDAKERLIILLNIFGEKLFNALEIPLILVSEFDNLTNENLIKYFITIFEKFLELLNQTIMLFDSYNLICIQLNNLINPIIINIDSKTIDSETNDEDIDIFCSKLSIKN
jgi:hypothetical protein